MTNVDGTGVPEGFNFARDVVEPLASDPNRRALTHVDRDGVIQRFTFAQISIEAARWAWLLRSQAYMPGDRVLVLLGKVPAWLGLMLGAIKGGLVTVPCSDQLRARDLAFRARHADASLIVADRSAQAEIDAMRGMLDRPIDVLYTDDASLLLERQPTTAPTEETSATDYAFLLYTSGTTHEPKGVAHTHSYTWAKQMQAEHWLGARPGDLVWCTAGTGWAKSIWNVLLGPWWRGAEIVMHERGFDPDERFELIDRLGVTVLCQAPTEYRLMAKSDALEGRLLSRLRHAVSAGEPLNPEVIDRFRDALGVTIYDGYGQTENTLLIANTRDHDLRPGSMGLPTPGHHVAVIDEAGAEVEAGVEGDIALAGRPPSLFARYWGAPDETAEAFRGDWYVTGDRARRDDDGYFWFAGRADDVIISAGYRIGPFEVESALLEHPAVAESAAVAKPDPDRGQIVKAFVVLRPGLEPSETLVGELQEHAKQVTAPYKYPREIEFVAELPKTRSGKIRRSELRALEVERAGAGAADAAPSARPRADATRIAHVEMEQAERLAADVRGAAAQDAADREARETEAAARQWAEDEAARQRAEEEADAQRETEQEARAAQALEEAEIRRRADEQQTAEVEQRKAEEERRKRDADEQRAAERQRRTEEEERLGVAEGERREQEAEARRLAEADRAAAKVELKDQQEARKRESELQRAGAKQQRKDDEERRKRETEEDRAAEKVRRQEAEERRREEESRRQTEEAERRAAEAESRRLAEEGKRRGADEERARREETERLAREDAERLRAEEKRTSRRARREPESAEEPEPESNPGLLQRLQRYGVRQPEGEGEGGAGDEAP